MTFVKDKGFTLVEMMFVVAIIALLAVLALPGLLRARATATDSAAKDTLKVYATALETYFIDHNQYPATVDVLLNGTMPYVTKEIFDGAVHDGFIYSVGVVTPIAYSLNAVPSTCGTSGTKEYTVTTGAVFSEVSCS